MHSKGLQQYIGKKLFSIIPSSKMALIHKLYEGLPQQFKVECVHCHKHVKMRSNVFLSNVIKRTNFDPMILITKYTCTKCRKAEHLNLLGQKQVCGVTLVNITLMTNVLKK